MTEHQIPAALREALDAPREMRHAPAPFDPRPYQYSDCADRARFGATLLRALGNTIMDPDEPVPTLDKVLWMISNWQNALDREASQ